MRYQAFYQMRSQEADLFRQNEECCLSENGKQNGNKSLLFPIAQANFTNASHCFAIGSGSQIWGRIK
jgi:hypothetical protein